MDTKKLVLIGQVCVWAGLLGSTGTFAAQPKAQDVEVEGSIVGVMPGMVQVKSLTGQPWMFRVSPKAKVEITGNAEKSFLHSGLFVEFKATLEKFHTTSKVTALTICSPSPQKYPGIFPEGGALQIPEQPTPKGKKKEKEFSGSGNCHVVGTIVGVKDGQYSLRTPNGLVIFEVDDNAEIKVELTSPQGLLYARTGDQIVIKGVAFREGMGEAREVTVKLLTALSASETGRPKKKVEKKPVEKPGETAPEEKPEKPASKKSSSQKLPKEENPPTQ
ncbi:MAG: hypothetical protein NZ602_11590 [Thermoguttaceae bacterium]|nr:hypothetical protein [Thermoguttaceae bacterium]MDW8039316.1 hypothetical protein [Thermoguttaceae bacterium]